MLGTLHIPCGDDNMSTAFRRQLQPSDLRLNCDTMSMWGCRRLYRYSHIAQTRHRSLFNFICHFHVLNYFCWVMSSPLSWAFNIINILHTHNGHNILRLTTSQFMCSIHRGARTRSSLFCVLLSASPPPFVSSDLGFSRTLRLCTRCLALSVCVSCVWGNVIDVLSFDGLDVSLSCASAKLKESTNESRKCKHCGSIGMTSSKYRFYINLCSSYASMCLLLTFLFSLP